MTRKLGLLGIIAILCLGRAAAAAPSETQKADALFEKQEFQPALLIYAKLAKSEKGEASWKATYRAAECEALLFRYLEGANRMWDAPLPQDPLWKARFLLLRAEMGREYLNQYGYNLTKETETGVSDRARWTAGAWHKEIRSQYSELARLESTLSERTLESESYFIETEKRDLVAFPTLWDFAVFRATDYLLNQYPAPPSGQKPAPESFLDGSYGTGVGESGSPAEQAGSLAERASRANESPASELWRLFRFQIPFQHANYVGKWKDAAASRAKAVSRLKDWAGDFRSHRAKADALNLAAQFLEADSKFADAVALCKDVERLYPKTQGAAACSDLRARVELPQLTVRFQPTQPGAKDTAELIVRNLETIHLRLYPTTSKELEGLLRNYNEGLDYLVSLPEQALEPFYGKKPEFTAQYPITYASPHAILKTKITVPSVKPGLYVALVGSDKHFEPRRSVMSGGVLNVTELFLFGSAGAPASVPLSERRNDFPAFHLYAIDGKSGAPAADAKFESSLRLNWNNIKRSTQSADKNGQASFPTRVTQDYQYQSLQTLARRGDHHAFFQQPLTYQHSTPEKFSLFVETDRPIYRPGQTLSFKVVALENRMPGWRVFDGKGSVKVTATDPNGQAFHTATVRPNAFGSASGKFVIPTGRLLGGYSLRLSLNENGKNYDAYKTFEVEEYKRPEFEVKVSEAKGPWKFGNAATVEGDASYYFGGGVPKATLSYRVTRETFIPWFCYWWRWRQPSEPKEIASGTLSTDETGHFKFSLTPEKDPEEESPLPAGYVVEVEARDAGGRTIKASRRFQAAATSALIAVEPASGFLKPNAETSLPAGLRTLNDTFAAGKGTFKVYSLSLPSPFPAPELSERLWRGKETNVSLDMLLAKIPDGDEVTKGTFLSSEKALGTLKLAPLKAGLYRIRLEAPDPTGGKLQLALVLAVGDEKSPAPAPQVTIAEHPKYVVGETARVLIGSKELTGGLFVEIWRGADLFEKRTLKGGNHVIAVPVTDALKGGFSIRWFGVTNFRLWSGETSVEVPWKEKELAVSLQAPASMKPGEKASWALKVLNSEKKPVDAEALVRIFDRSLEYYASDAGSWAGHLYSSASAPFGYEDSYFLESMLNISVEQGWLEKQLGILRGLVGAKMLPPPSLRPIHSRYYGHRGRSFGLKGGGTVYQAEAEMDGTGDSAMMMKAEGAPPAAKAKKSADKSPVEKRADDDEAAPAVRSDFSETALFEPHLTVKDGKAVVSFKAPERLTSWKVQGTVLTKDVRTGALSAEFATKKELMVRVEMPRFLRENDHSTLKAMVHNETGKPFSAEVQLSILKGESDAGAAFGVASEKRKVSVEPGAVAAVSWNVKAPKDLSRFKVRAIARSAKLVDAEERELPVLPSKARLVESKLAYLEGSDKESFPLPAHLKAGELEAAYLQIDPQLAGLMLNSLPQLVLYPFDCTEQLINRIVPVTLVQKLFEKHPELKAAAAKIPKRKTINPAWDLSDPRRLTDLAETPWAAQAKGATPSHPAVDLTRPEILEKVRSKAMATLESYQLASGGFPWFPGGREDLYLTLYVLEGFEELLRHGLPIPEAMAKKAYAYTVSELQRHFKDEEGSLSIGLYGAFVLSAYVEKYPWAASGKALSQKWLEHADEHSRALTAFGMGYAAWVAHRLGDPEKAAKYLERATSGSRQDKLTGVYWQPEKMSWLWYHDTDEKHAFLLRTLQTLKPKDPRIPGMVQWLLFHRKGNEWKSTRTSAAALYALLDYFQAKGALKGEDKYQWSWGQKSESVSVKGSDFLTKPLRWAFTSAPAASPLTLNKTGPGIGIASFTTIFSTDDPDAHTNAADNLMSLERRIFKRVKSGSDYKLDKLSSGDTVSVGDVIEVQLVVNSRSSFEYLHLKAPRPAGLEAESLTSGWKWEDLSRYEEIRDSMENFFVSWLPQGEFILRYRLRATTAGEYKFGPTLLQSMYSPDFSAYVGGFALKIRE